MSGSDDRQPNAGDAAEVSGLYPDRLLPIAGEHVLLAGEDAKGDLRERYEAFSVDRENLLLDYRYNTARAYWGDLDDLFWWCEHRGFDIYALTRAQANQYFGLLRRRRYSENTIRRRGTTLNRWQSALTHGP